MENGQAPEADCLSQVQVSLLGYPGAEAMSLPAEKIPGPLGDYYSAEKKRMKVMLSLPSADAAADLHFDEVGPIPDIPVDQMVYRSSRGLLLTSSMIARGVGAGQMMTAAGEMTDLEAKDLYDNLFLLPSRTAFEDDLMRTIKSELGSRWV